MKRETRVSTWGRDLNFPFCQSARRWPLPAVNYPVFGLPRTFPTTVKVFVCPLSVQDKKKIILSVPANITSMMKLLLDCPASELLQLAISVLSLSLTSCPDRKSWPDWLISALFFLHPFPRKDWGVPTRKTCIQIASWEIKIT